jgi:hypothetical protein
VGLLGGVEEGVQSGVTDNDRREEQGVAGGVESGVFSGVEATDLSAEV